MNAGISDKERLAAIGASQEGGGALLGRAAQAGQLYSQGWRTAALGTKEAVEPATGRTLGLVGMAEPADIAKATRDAAAAQQDWARQPYTIRAEILRRAGDLWRQYAAEIDGWIVREAGSVPGKAARETEMSARECYAAAALAEQPFGEVLRSAEPRLSLARRLPAGIVGVITPFNFPLILAMRSVAPALTLGNAVILKPDLRTAICGGISIARIFEEAGLPAGLLHVLPGDAAAGAALVSDPLVRVISFTGSTSAGKRVAELGAQHLKRVHLELGGNSALIVLQDADLDKAVSMGLWGSFNHQGQICMATGRHLVHASIADAYAERLAARAAQLRVGNPAEAQVDLGPIIDRQQRDHVHGLVTASVKQGAKLLAGGTYDDLFYRPTVVINVNETTSVYHDEVFGPVAPVMPFANNEEAVRLAASSDYGLALGVITNNIGAALEIAEQIPAGMVHINDQTVDDEPTVPFGGMGASGTGARFGGHWNLEAFTETQWLTVRARTPWTPFEGRV